ncbi:putative Serine/threonine protein kinase [Anopheles sinensis]|uniref:Putative Serine/threonine protein kinase n=1 Tax=Anopheles sinensis TaxID=74873 RepID=A0A084VKN5_ANOSI|nr:putative Serine/threonine protein kinase [Anopheles sinensis]
MAPAGTGTSRERGEASVNVDDAPPGMGKPKVGWVENACAFEGLNDLGRPVLDGFMSLVVVHRGTGIHHSRQWRVRCRDITPSRPHQSPSDFDSAVGWMATALSVH